MKRLDIPRWNTPTGRGRLIFFGVVCYMTAVSVCAATAFSRHTPTAPQATATDPRGALPPGYVWTKSPEGDMPGIPVDPRLSTCPFPSRPAVQMVGPDGRPMLVISPR